MLAILWLVTYYLLLPFLSHSLQVNFRFFALVAELLWWYREVFFFHWWLKFTGFLHCGIAVVTALFVVVFGLLCTLIEICAFFPLYCVLE